MYSRHKEELEQFEGSTKEKQLFHSTNSEETVKGICYQNFDPRLHGKNATMYGKGAYFAENASYSNRYASHSGKRYMFLAKVLVGRSTKGDTSMARPPPLPPHLQSTNKQHDLYDSTVDNVLQPTIYVVYEMEKCYPAYLILYKSKGELVRWKTYRNQDSSEPDLEYPLAPMPAPRLNLPPKVSPAAQSLSTRSSSTSLPSSLPSPVTSQSIRRTVRTAQAAAPVQSRVVPPRPVAPPPQAAQPTQATGTSSTRGSISSADSIDSYIDWQMHNLDRELNRHREALRASSFAQTTSSASGTSSSQGSAPTMARSTPPIYRSVGSPSPPARDKDKSCNIQ